MSFSETQSDGESKVIGCDLHKKCDVILKKGPAAWIEREGPRGGGSLGGFVTGK